MATGARIWAKRSETYEALLSWAGRFAVNRSTSPCGHWRRMTPCWSRASGTRPYSRKTIQVGLAAYSSAAVNEAAHTFLESLDQLAEAAERAVETPGQDAVVEVHLLALQHERLADHVAQVISNDLHDVIAPDYGRAS